MQKTENEIPPLCACNCGMPVKRSKTGKKWNKYIHGHNSRSSSNNAKFKLGNKFGKGRPQGSRNKVTEATINLIKGEGQALSRKAIDSALNGNTQMLQFCLARILPPPPKDKVVKLEGMPSCNDVHSAGVLSSFILQKLGEGKLTPNQAHIISSIVEKHLHCLSLVDVEARLEKLEQQMKQAGLKVYPRYFIKREAKPYKILYNSIG